jgi:TonB-dependent receptor
MKRLRYALFFSMVLVTASRAATGTIDGIVKDESGGLPLASLVVEGKDIGTSSDRNGRFRLRDVPVGQQVLIISYIGYETKKIEVDFEAGEVVDLGSVALKASSISMQEILVESSYRHGENRARVMEKESPTIVTVLAADAIGKLPDRNAAEAIQRMPGVQMERDQGEGRYVTVRSVPSSWTAMHINGTRIPDARNGSRDIALDIFPSQFIEYIEVTKAHTPDQEGDAIGGSVNFLTRMPTSERRLEFNFSGGLHGQSKSGIYDNSVTYANQLADGKVRFVLLGAASSRDWGSDNYEVYYQDDHSLDELQLRDYLGNRSTYGVNWGAEADLSAKTTLYSHGMLSTFSDDEIRRRDRYRFGSRRYEMAFTATRYRSSLQAGTVGLKHHFSNALKADWSLFANRSTYGYDSPDNLPDSQHGYYAVTFRQSGIEFDGLTQDGKKFLDIDAPAGYTGDPYDNIQPQVSAATPLRNEEMKFQNATSSFYETVGNDFATQLDFDYKLNERVDFKLGGKYRWLRADIDRAYFTWTYENDAYLSDFPLESYPANGGFLTEIDEIYDPILRSYPTLESINNAHRNEAFGPELSEQNKDNSSRATSVFEVQENQYAFYAMPNWHISDKLQLVAGLRAELTDATSNSYAWLADAGRAVPTGAGNDYLAVLPMATLTYRPQERFNVRAAVSRAYVRPNFLDIAPFESVDEVEATISRGNPDLDPTYALNYDLMTTYYAGSLSAFSAGAFYKDISDYISSGRTQRELSYPGIETQTYTISQPFNLEEAWLWGVEFAYSQSLAFLPGLWNGLGFSVNYTYTQSETTLPERDGDPIPLQNQSPHTLNAQLSYEKSGLSMRLASNYRAPFIDSYNERSSQDRWRDRTFQMDFNASYALTDDINLYFEMINLNNDPLRYYNGKNQNNRPEQAEWYSRRGSMGIHLSMF